MQVNYISQDALVGNVELSRPRERGREKLVQHLRSGGAERIQRHAVLISKMRRN